MSSNYTVNGLKNPLIDRSPVNKSIKLEIDLYLFSLSMSPLSSGFIFYWSTFLQYFLVDPFFLFFFVCSKSATEQPSPDLHSNPRPRPSAGGAAAATCRRAARTSARSATLGAKAGRREGGRRRPKRNRSSGAGHRAATTTPTKRNRATATSATTSNRSTAADRAEK